MKRPMDDQRPTVIGDGQAPIHVVPKLDPCAGVATLQRPQWDHQGMA